MSRMRRRRRRRKRRRRRRSRRRRRRTMAMTVQRLERSQTHNSALGDSVLYGIGLGIWGSDTCEPVYIHAPTS